MELSHLDKVTFQSLYRLKVQTCSDNAPTVAPDKVPRNRRLRAGSFLREQPGTHGSAPILRIGAPLPGHSLEKLSAVLMASAPFAPARCAKPCLKCRLRLKSTEKPDGKCEDFSRWWSGERRRDGVNGDNTALRQNRYTFCSNYAIL